MDRVMLIHAKSTHRVYLPGNERRSITNRHTDREMSVISTYLNVNTQTPLGRFVVDILYHQVCNKYSDKSNWWSLSLKPCIASTVQGAINSGPSSTTLLISINGVSWRSFSKSTVAHARVTWAKARPFQGRLVVHMLRLAMIDLCYTNSPN